MQAQLYRTRKAISTLVTHKVGDSLVNNIVMPFEGGFLRKSTATQFTLEGTASFVNFRNVSPEIVFGA